VSNRITHTLLALSLVLGLATGAQAQIREKQLSSTFTGELIRRGGTVAFTADQPMGGNKLTGLAAGTAAGDAVNFAQLSAAAAGLDPKASVRYCSDAILDDNADLTAAVPVYTNTGGTSGRGQITAVLTVSGTISFDGIAAVAGDRIMIHDEGLGGGLGADANGVYTVGIAGTALTLDRALDFDEDVEVTAGAFFFVEEGTVCGGHGYVLQGPNPLIVGGATGDDLFFSIFSRVDFGTSGVTTVDAGDTVSVGTGLAARIDHEHAVSTGAASTQSPDVANAEGTATTLARSDHIHNIPADVAVGASPDQANAEGASTSFSRANHEHAHPADVAGAIQPDDVAAEGNSTSFSRANHVHSIVAAVAGTISPDDAAAEGVATSFSRSDHQHAIAAGAAVDVGTANAEGAASDFSRSNHVHDSPQAAKGNKNGTASVTTGALETTGLTIASLPALDTYPWISTNGIAYNVGDASTASDYYYSGDACSTARAITAIAAADVLCQGSNLPFNHDATDRISQHYLTFVNN